MKGRLVGLVVVLLTVAGGGSVWGFRTSGSSNAGRPSDVEAAGASGTRTATSAGARTGQVARPIGGHEVIDQVKARWVMDENARPGTAAWRLTKPARDHEIEGYIDRVSTQQGDTITLYVSTKAPSYQLDAYRMGYYGGAGARLVWQAPVQPGHQQAPSRRDEITNTVDAPWDPSLRVPITSDWPPGDYLFKLTASTGLEQWVPLTVRDDDSTAAFVVQNSVTTWQAYNLWHGYDLYAGEGGSSFAHRSRIVSFDRPYELGAGAGDFPGNELPLVSLVESLGLDVTYWTDVDLHERPQLLTHHRALISLGHDEYWSTTMRRAAEDGRDHGVNLAFLGANAIFRHIRFEPSDLGPDRHEVAYKSASEDPLRHQDDAEVTVNWREPPVNDPESKLLGEQYECNPVKADFVVAEAGSWLFAGTGLHEGDHLDGVVGPEYDRYYRGQQGPPNVEVVGHSPVRCRGTASYSDMSYYTAPSGAGVFDSGTNWWVVHLSAPCGDPAACPHNDGVVRITENLLDAFGRGPAAQLHPSVPSTAGTTRGGGSEATPPTTKLPAANQGDAVANGDDD